MSDRPGQTPRDDAAAYVLGALTEPETREFEAALARSPELLREVDSYRQLSGELAAVAETAEGAVPSASLRARVLERIRDSGPAVAVPGSPFMRPARTGWLAFAASVVLLLLAVGAWILAMDENSRLRRSLAAADAALDSSRMILADREQLLETILAPGTRLEILTGTGDVRPEIQLFWNEKQQIAILNATHLAPAPSGRTYQLWFIRDGKPVPSVTFNTRVDGSALLGEIALPAGPGATVVAVTEEPAGGSPEPTTTPFLVGRLTRS